MKKNAKMYSSYYRLSCATAEEKLKKRNLSKEEREEAEMWYERKQRCNEGSRKRMAKMNAGKRADEKKGKAKKAMTRREYDKKKNYETERKQKYRAKKSTAETAKINEQRREKYAIVREMKVQGMERKMKEMEQKLKDQEDQLRAKERELLERTTMLQNRNNDLGEDAIDIRSNDARRKSLQRARGAMPQRRSHFVSTTIDLVEKASPRKTAALKKAGITGRNPLHDGVMKALGDVFSGPRNSPQRKHIAMSLSALKNVKQQRKAARHFGCSRKLLQRARKQSAGRKGIPSERVKLIGNFYQANSNPLPDKKFVSKKTYKPRHLMESTVADLYHKYKKMHPDQPVSAGIFYSLRPKNVKTKAQAKYVGCLCEYCENINLKIEAVNSIHKGTFKDGYDVIRTTMCPKPPGCDFNHPSCITRKCTKCGVDKMDQRLHPILADPNKSIKWKRWTMVTTTCFTKKGTKQVKKRKPIEMKGTAMDLVTELKTEIHPFSEHLFNKDWQNNQQKNLLNNIHMDEVLGVYDFAENFKCEHQREVQSAYYAQDSATVHPVVTYYSCPKCLKSVRESIIIISDDLNHDYHLVNTFHRKVTNHLTATRGLMITKFYRFSDGCSCQYKSKGPISDISYGREDFGHTIHHNYSGTRHGKGASDGESGVVKRKAAEAVKAGTAIISTPKQLYDYLEGNVTKDATEDQCCTSFRRSVLFVKHEEVLRKRQDRAIRTVPGTRKFHSIKSVKGGRVATRNLSCFCDSCLGVHGGTGRCVNAAYVHPWKEVKLKNGKTGEEDTALHASEEDTALHSGEEDSAHPTGEEDTAHPTSMTGEEDTALHSGEEDSAHPTGEEDTAHPTSMTGEEDTALHTGEDSALHTGEEDSALPTEEVVAHPHDDNIKDGANLLTTIGAQDFVAVRVTSTGRRARSDELHVAQVASVPEDGSYSLSYMVKAKGSNQYTWSQGDEVFFLQPITDIVAKLDAPEPVAVGSRLFFKFNLKGAEELFSAK
ncbi:uncharacterized protein LOC117292604 [Asterias rubens]|uniref:uncharacterized protein LOC117292604 n=1 Tax=Asterias rubens TaxID=7604 RepID=UPI001455ACD9|nr:uncharacterized protein LOC117292604 [Asterias rubens]